MTNEADLGARQGPDDQSTSRMGGPSTVDTAKDEAGQLAGTAAEASKDVAGTAKEETRKVAEEAARQVRSLTDQARTEMVDQASAQQQRAASGMRSLAEELRSMADAPEQPGMGTDLARQASQRLDAMAQWLEEREPGGLVDEVKSFARQRPGAFLAIAAGAGVLAGRLTRGMRAPAGGSGGSSGGSPSQSMARPETSPGASSVPGPRTSSEPPGPTTVDPRVSPTTGPVREQEFRP